MAIPGLKAREHAQAQDATTQKPGREEEAIDNQKELGNGSQPELKHREDDEEEIASIKSSRSSSHASTASQHDDASPRPNEKARPTTLSRTTSVSPDAVVVPGAQRRGLLARFTLIPEVQNPYHYTNRTKWFLTFIVAVCAMAGPMGSAMVLPVLEEISVAFKSTHTVTNLSVALYMLSMAIFPLWWSSFSERLGRRTIYITSFTLFVVFAVLSAISTNIAMLIIMRMLSGGAAASVQAVGAGTISDIWEVRERGRAMSVFYLGPLCGPLFAPIIGGAIGSALGWRSTQWFLVIYGGATLIFIILALPETLAKEKPSPSATAADDKESPPASTRTSPVQKAKMLFAHSRQIFLDPLKIITWLRYPAVATTVYYASITFGCLYILNISIQSTFAAAPYNFSTLIIGLLYIPNSFGYLLASMFGGRWIDRIMHREARKAGRFDDKGKLIFQPEDRMKENAWIAAVLWPGALIWYGWTAEKGVLWIVPMIANFFFGIGSMLIFGLVTTMLTELMPKRAASAIALNNFVRNIFSFTGALVADPILSAIGNGWLMTILGIWSLVTGFMALGAMKRWGEKWRVALDEGMGTD
ncbi:MFS general substrate transporter [Dothidotthia symphoricarpi CBS 119687]|uniref:MFS general substrate transporter n=1 Tax=Dothidotthia symphoricarpi CBS 119687 TaxID=1392245 RepID=A0A6A6APD0_9PLEO|nr:MFS general substrate transporter [Dothidotthia symphoricarpi CBS 119687]KAF2133779.1 MFS general substrate transporter [Dothidotthia symphoricarpi CBS 119687]